MSKGLVIDYETADRITVCTLRDQLEYLLREQQWFEASEEIRATLQEQWGFGLYVHPEDYANNASKYIPALQLMIDYFGGKS